MDKPILQSHIANGLSANAIAKIEKTSPTNVRYWLRKHGLKTRYKFRSGDALIAFAVKNGLSVIASKDWAKVQSFYDDGHSQRATARQFDMAVMTLRKAIQLGYLIPRSKSDSLKLKARAALRSKRRLTTAQKRHLSLKRREYLLKTNRPAWKVSQYHKSIPCELLKAKLSTNGFQFKEEFEPLRDQGRFFSIDIAFPKEKIGIEVNGRQHYGSDGKLTPYHQSRHDLIQSAGWTLLEIPYHHVFSAVLLEDLFSTLSKMVVPSGAAPDHGANLAH